MPRKPRAEVAGGVHHVYARGNDRRDVFLIDGDRRLYLSLLKRVAARQDWRCLAYCLMGNHVHLLVRTEKPNLGDGMRRLHGVYAQTFNARIGRDGHVFQGRFGSRLVTTDEQLWTTLGYIAANPVEAGLCRSASQWPWSSHRGMLGLAEDDVLDRATALGLMKAFGGDPESRYATLVAARE
jgi:REP element-mobilizing transposase RayT